MQTEKRKKPRWTNEEKALVSQYLHLGPHRAMCYFPGRSYKSVKGMFYQRNKKHTKVYYTPSDFYVGTEGLSRAERFKLEYRHLPAGEHETNDLAQLEVPKIINFDIYSMRYGFTLDDKLLDKRAA